MDGFIEYKGHKYSIDLNKALEFIYGNPEKKLSYETAITQSWGYPTSMSIEEVGKEDMQQISKEITESKSSLNDVMINVRYDIIKNLLSLLTDSEEGSQKFSLAFNTLYNEKIIIEIF